MQMLSQLFYLCNEYIHLHGWYIVCIGKLQKRKKYKEEI